MTDKRQETTQPSFLLTRKRLISFPADRENEEFSVANGFVQNLTLDGLVKAHEMLQEALNRIELRAWQNHREMNERLAEIENLEHHNRILREEAKSRELAKNVLSILSRKPNTSLGDIAGILNKTEDEVRNASFRLQQEGKLRQSGCPRVFEVIENPPIIPIGNEEQENMDSVTDDDRGL